MTTQNTIINIDGMTCDGCVNSVTNALKQVNGVQSVTVSLANKNAAISFDDNQTSTDALKEAIEDAGYDVAN